jgi:dihydrofolate reductase/thymidylate synthase
MKFALIAAADKHNGIGKNNGLAWKLAADMKYFSDVTTRTHDPFGQNAVIMGRKTWESLPEKHRPLKNRYNIILSREIPPQPAASPEESNPMINPHWADSLEAALNMCDSKLIEHVFVIGGARVYAEAINHPDCQTIYLTRIDQAFDCDAFFPAIDEKLFQIKDRSGKMRENGLDFEFLTYERKA